MTTHWLSPFPFLLSLIVIQGIELKGSENNSFLTLLKYFGVSSLHFLKYFVSLLGMVWLLCSPVVLPCVFFSSFFQPYSSHLPLPCCSRSSDMGVPRPDAQASLVLLTRLVLVALWVVDSRAAPPWFLGLLLLLQQFCWDQCSL